MVYKWPQSWKGWTVWSRTLLVTILLKLASLLWPGITGEAGARWRVQSHSTSPPLITPTRKILVHTEANSVLHRSITSQAGERTSQKKFDKPRAYYINPSLCLNGCSNLTSQKISPEKVVEIYDVNSVLFGDFWCKVICLQYVQP